MSLTIRKAKFSKEVLEAKFHPGSLIIYYYMLFYIYINLFSTYEILNWCKYSCFKAEIAVLCRL